MSDKLFTCPYDSTHVMKMTRAHYHIIECRKMNKHKNFIICPYNALHHYPPEKSFDHIKECSDRMTTIDSSYIQYENTPNTQGNLAVPPPPKIPQEEEWSE